MSSATVTLPAARRGALGRTAAAVRRTGYVPAILYGHGQESVPLAVEATVFLKLLPTISSSTLLTLTVDGGDPRRVLIQEVQRHPLTGLPTHVDFHAVSLTEKIRAKVPLVATGVSPAVRDQGGVLIQSVGEIEVEALPQDLPSDIPVDLGRLATFEDQITIADLSVPKGVAVHAKPEEIVAVVQPPRSEEELKAELETPAAAPAVGEVKTEAEVKKAAEEVKKAEHGEAVGNRQPDSAKASPGRQAVAKREEKKPEGKKGEKKKEEKK